MKCFAFGVMVAGLVACASDGPAPSALNIDRAGIRAGDVEALQAAARIVTMRTEQRCGLAVANLPAQDQAARYARCLPIEEARVLAEIDEPVLTAFVEG